MKPLSDKGRKISRYVIVVLCLALILYSKYGSEYPEYSDLISVEATLVEVEYHRKSHDILHLKLDGGEERKLYYHFFKKHKGIIERLVGHSVVFKFYDFKRLWTKKEVLAEIYVGDERVFGDYRAVLERVNSGQPDIILYIFLGLFGFLFLLSYVKPEGKE